MKLWFAVLLLTFELLVPQISQAHVGSPDVFFEGMVGSCPARVIIRMPGVVPGRATIRVEIENGLPAKVFFRPLYFDAAVSNAPPAEEGFLLSGTTNWYEGDLWLMAHGGYTIEVKIAGAAGNGSIQIPVNSVATQQLKMPVFMGALLLLLGAGLVFGAIAIVVGAARDAVLAPGETPSVVQSRKGRIAGVVTTCILIGLLFFGLRWWRTEEGNFRMTLRQGGWPHLTSAIHIKAGQPWLDLTVGKRKNRGFDDDDEDTLSLAPDHGKLAHLFLISQPDGKTFAHLHPVRTGGREFSAALPPLPPGKYSLFCDFTLESMGISCTTTDTVTLSNGVFSSNAAASTKVDADDSWATFLPQNPPHAETNTAYVFPDGTRVIWQKHLSATIGTDAGLNFEVWDANGKPAKLEPYMEMLSHGVVMRSDGKVFIHLHPMGNYSMASQDFFQSKLARETGDASAALCGMPLGTNEIAKSRGNTHATLISLPYEFPSSGNYRIWVQFKKGGKIYTAFFDADVSAKAGA